jgi:hypothetical protein
MFEVGAEGNAPQRENAEFVHNSRQAGAFSSRAAVHKNYRNTGSPGTSCIVMKKGAPLLVHWPRVLMDTAPANAAPFFLHCERSYGGCTSGLKRRLQETSHPC